MELKKSYIVDFCKNYYDKREYLEYILSLGIKESEWNFLTREYIDNTTLIKKFLLLDIKDVSILHSAKLFIDIKKILKEIKEGNQLILLDMEWDYKWIFDTPKHPVEIYLNKFHNF